jgi:spermidine/putrescine transport system substrate-binding protein
VTHASHEGRFDRPGEATPLATHLDRRRLLGAGGALFFSLAGLARAMPLRNADTGTVKLITYINWYGATEFKDFAKTHPGEKAEPVIINVDEDRIAKLATDPGAADLVLITERDVQRLVDLGVAQKLDLAHIRNYTRYVSAAFRFGYASTKKAMAVATDYGWTGYGYRKDIVGEKLTSWADIWRLKKKLKGKITLLDFPGQTIPSTLLMLGYSPSTTNSAQIKAAGKKLIELKPYLQSFSQTDMTKGLLDGSVAIAMDWNYDMAPAVRKNKNIEWVTPKEGGFGYLDTWVALNHSKHLPIVWDLMNFHFDPRTYAKFVNFTGTAFCEPAARKYVNPEIANSRLLFPPSAELKRIVYGKPVGRAQIVYDDVWAQVKAA